MSLISKLPPALSQSQMTQLKSENDAPDYQHKRAPSANQERIGQEPSEPVTRHDSSWSGSQMRKPMITFGSLHKETASLLFCFHSISLELLFVCQPRGHLQVTTMREVLEEFQNAKLLQDFENLGNSREFFLAMKQKSYRKNSLRLRPRSRYQGTCFLFYLLRAVLGYGSTVNDTFFFPLRCAASIRVARKAISRNLTTRS